MTAFDTRQGQSGSISSLFRRPSSILTYHTLVPKPSLYVYSTSLTQFREHLRWISQIPSSSLLIESRPDVTFDDGRVSDHQFALPVLEDYKVRATFFVSAGLIENQADFMNWRQVRELISLGHSVQSHGWSHLLLTQVSKLTLYRELEMSKKKLEDRLGVLVDSISLPGGRWNADVLYACGQVGYRRVFHSDPWLLPEMRMNVLFSGRLMMRNTTDVQKLGRLLTGRGGEILWLRTQRGITEIARRVVGDRGYHYMWHAIARLAKLADRRQDQADSVSH